MTYTEVAELTWPQLMHAMGIDPNCREDDLAERLTQMQDAIFDGILACRGYLPIDLLRVPAKDLAELARGEGRLPAIESLLASLRRYVDERTVGG